MRKEKTVYLITGDIGGTNSRMSLYTMDRRDQGQNPNITKTFKNADHLPESVLGEEKAFIEYILNPFLMYCWKPETQAENKVQLEPIVEFEDSVILICCIASAGVVSDNRVRLTNLGNLLICGTLIEKDQSSIYMNLIVKCLVINDFVAQGYGCLTLKPCEVRHLYGPHDLEVFSPDSTTAKGPKVCVGAGTGLGECYLTQSAHAMSHDPYSCFPSEGGHVEYAARNALEVELFEYLSRKFDSRHRISVERVVSGTGLANVYEFLAQKYPDRVLPELHQQIMQEPNEKGKLISQGAATSGNSNNGGALSLCRQAMDIMFSAYGCEVGSAAIKWIPTGGLFVSGGLTPKNIDFIQGLDSEFMKAYLHKGRVSPILERIPLYAVMTEDLGVRGAHKGALLAYENFCEQQKYSTTANKINKKNDGSNDSSGSTDCTEVLLWRVVVVGVTVASVVSIILPVTLSLWWLRPKSR